MNPHDKAYVCIHVFEETAPVLLVSRPEGDWCFLCGEVHGDDAADYRVVGIGHVFDKDPTLADVKDLESDSEAERDSVGGTWLRTRITPDA